MRINQVFFNKKDKLILLMFLLEFGCLLSLLFSFKSHAQELVVGGLSTVNTDTHPFVYPGEIACGEDGLVRYPPDRILVDEIQLCTQKAVKRDMYNGTFLSANGVPFTPLEIETYMNFIPFVAWFNAPRYVHGWNGGDPNCQPCWLCAAGVSGYPYISVSLKDNTRVLRLVAWETLNFYMVQLGRWDYADSYKVAEYTNECAPYYNYVYKEHVVFSVPTINY